jgi:ribosomal protein L11 methyltransferase
MTQTRLHLTTSKAEAERIFAAMETAFEEDGWPISVLELDEDRDLHEVSLYADGDIDAVETQLRDLLTALSVDKPLEREVLPDIDWVARSLEGLKPVRAGRFFVHGAHDRDQIKPGDIPIEIEAGLAFGTGHHGTTAGCLEVLESVVEAEHPKNALDLGTGSAVLAIALAKLAAIPVLATDIDPVATEVATANVKLNDVWKLVETATATGFDHPFFAERGPFAHLQPGGSLVLSGILDRQHDAVVAAYTAQGFRHIRTLHLEGWVTIHLKR